MQITQWFKFRTASTERHLNDGETLMTQKAELEHQQAHMNKLPITRAPWLTPPNVKEPVPRPSPVGPAREKSKDFTVA